MLTGEHGVGIEKRDLMGTMFTEDDLKQQQRVKCAFDPTQNPEPGQGVPPAPPLRGAGADAHPQGADAVPGLAAVLRQREPLVPARCVLPAAAEASPP